MQEKVTQFLYNFADALTIYDYLGFALLLLLFLLFIVIAILARARVSTALFFSLLAFMLLTVGPFGVKAGFDYLIRANDVQISNFKKLIYSDSVAVEGKLTNIGKIDFSKCLVRINIVKDVENEYLQHLYNLKPLATKMIELNKIAMNDSKSFQIVIDEFTLQKDFSVIAKGECYP